MHRNPVFGDTNLNSEIPRIVQCFKAAKPKVACVAGPRWVNMIKPKQTLVKLTNINSTKNWGKPLAKKIVFP